MMSHVRAAGLTFPSRIVLATEATMNTTDRDPRTKRAFMRYPLQPIKAKLGTKQLPCCVHSEGSKVTSP
jgi:hypothetical protein